MGDQDYFAMPTSKLSSTDALDIVDASVDVGNGSSNHTIIIPSIKFIQSPYLQFFVIFLYIATSIAGLIGNTLVISVLYQGKRTQGHLRVFLINLAVSDILMAVFSIPFTFTMFILGKWVFPPTTCSVVLFMQQVCVLVSVYTIVAIGIDRAVLYPFERHTRKRRSKLTASIIWIGSMIFSISLVKFIYDKKFAHTEDDNYDCGAYWDSKSLVTIQIYTTTILIVTFLAPLLILIYTFTAVSIKLWRHSHPGNANPASERNLYRVRRKIIKMLVTLLIFFIVSWLPLQAFIIAYHFDPKFTFLFNGEKHSGFNIFYVICQLLACANGILNPFIYSYMSSSFWHDIRDFFCHDQDLERRRQISIDKSHRTNNSAGDNYSYGRRGAMAVVTGATPDPIETIAVVERNNEGRPETIPEVVNEEEEEQEADNGRSTAFTYDDTYTDYYYNYTYDYIENIREENVSPIITPSNENNETHIAIPSNHINETHVASTSNRNNYIVCLPSQIDLNYVPEETVSD